MEGKLLEVLDFLDNSHHNQSKEQYKKRFETFRSATDLPTKGIKDKLSEVTGNINELVELLEDTDNIVWSIFEH